MQRMLLRYLHVLAQQLQKPSRTNAHAARTALTTQGAAQSLVQLLLWLSDPTTAVATASGVLAEALPALRLMAADEDMRQVLAAADGPHEWEPAATALRRRLPRRMAARFLPEVDRVSAAVGAQCTCAGRYLRRCCRHCCCRGRYGRAAAGSCHKFIP